jgi:putative tryptophan/tyrosine transport system substrate-binding protein
MRRRDFITLVGGSAVAWPLALRAQQSVQIRRIAVLMPFAKDNSEGQARIAAFVQGLQKLGWTEGRNLQIEYRWGSGDLQKAAAELVALSPDVIFANSTPAVAALQQATQSVPIVFANIADPGAAECACDHDHGLRRRGDQEEGRRTWSGRLADQAD